MSAATASIVSNITDAQVRELRDSLLVDEQSLDLYNACVRALGTEPTTGAELPRHLPEWKSARQTVADAICDRDTARVFRMLDAKRRS